MASTLTHPRFPECGCTTLQQHQDNMFRECDTKYTLLYNKLKEPDYAILLLMDSTVELRQQIKELVAEQAEEEQRSVNGPKLRTDHLGLSAKDRCALFGYF